MYEISDETLKIDIESLEGATNKLKALKAIKFRWTEEAIKSRNLTVDDGENPLKEIGVTAQSVKEVLPELVQERADGTLTVNYLKLVPVAIASIQELKTTVDDLLKRVIFLEMNKKK